MPRPALQINCGQAELEARDSYTVEKNTFVKEGIAIGPGGIGHSPDDLQSQFKVEDFEMHEILGRGASCVCRRAVHKPTGVQMAVKIINMADSVKRQQLVTELRTLITPPGASAVLQFVNMVDAFFHEGFVYIALEFMDLGSIDNIQKKCGARVPEIRLAYMLREIITGLYMLHHQRNQLHRDIKPGNILFNSEGAVKLGDFGISKTLEESLGGGFGKAQKEASTYIGTSLYMSPERLQGKKYTFTSDIWSVGIMAIELATGHYPYDTSGGLYALMSHVTEGPPPMPAGPEYSVEFVDFLVQSLHLNHETRAGTEQLLAHPYLQTPHAQDRAGFIQWLHSI